MPTKVRWIQKHGKHPRQFGAEELLEDHIAKIMIERGVCELCKPPKTKRVVEPPKHKALDADESVTRKSPRARRRF